MRATSPNAERPQHPLPPSVFWHAAWLTISIVAVKVSYVGMATFWNWAARPQDFVSSDFVRWAAAASSADTGFALAVSLAAAALVWLASSRPRLGHALATGFVALGLLFVIYAVVGRQIFSYYKAPFTFQLLLLAGEPARLWSSIEAFITPWAVLALVALPASYLLLARASRRVELRLERPFRLAVRGGLLLLGAAWLAIGQHLVGSAWFEAQDRHFKESPHAVFLHSLALSIGNPSAALGGTAYAAVDASDFRPPARLAREPRTVVGSGSSSRRPNVILIVLESVGARYLGVYGSALDTTPSLLAERSNYLIFDNYYAPVGWTAYSLLSLAMSQRPPMERYNELSFRASTMQGASVAEVLAEAGYRTAFLAAGDPDWASAGFLERKGFREVLRFGDLPGATPVSSWGAEDRVLFEKMASWVEQNAGEPFFLMAWTDQTHHPYAIAPGQKVVDVLPPENRQGNPSLANYTSLIREVDSQIGRFLAWLRERGLADDTIVIVTGDHGEAFGEPHGGSGHGFTAYDEELRVPLIIWNPRLFRDGGRVTTVGSHIDLAPTILDLLGLRSPNGWDGASLFDERKPPRAYLFAAAWGQYLLGVRSGDWKYIYDARLGSEELYNLTEDPDERRDLSRLEPVRASELRRRLAAWLDVERQRSQKRRQPTGH
jgi:arylsulfatase A-like enzyme